MPPELVLRVGLVGAGRWGVNYLRALPSTRGAQLVAICEIDPLSLERARQLAPMATPVRELAALLPIVDAVVIATPATSHAEIAMRCLDARKHVLVEKPLTTDIAAGAALIERANKQGCVLRVGHLTLHSTVLGEMKRLLGMGAVGAVERIDVVRTSDGARFSRDSPLWSLGPHDVANVLFVSGPPNRVREVWQSGADEAGIELELSSGAVASMRWSRAASVAERYLAVKGAEGTLFFDEAKGVLQLIQRGRVAELAAAPPTGLLDQQLAHFVESIASPALVDAELALQVVRVLSAAQDRLDLLSTEQKLSVAV